MIDSPDKNSSEPDSGIGFVSPVPISEAIFRHIGREIIEGRIPPGERLLETKLCEQFGCSRSPLREAIRMLAAENLVTIEPRRGARVTQLTDKEITDLFQVRIELEGLSARLAALSATPDQIASLEALNEQMEESVSVGEIPKYFTLNAEFHVQIAMVSGNEYLMSLQKSTIERSFQTLFSFYTDTDMLRKSINKHDELLRTIRERDASASEALMREHIEATRDEAVELFDKRPLIQNQD